MLYLNPDTMMPLASAFAAIAGVVMLFWQKVKTVAGRVIGKVRRATQKDA